MLTHNASTLHGSHALYMILRRLHAISLKTEITVTSTCLLSILFPGSALVGLQLRITTLSSFIPKLLQHNFVTVFPPLVNIFLIMTLIECIAFCGCQRRRFSSKFIRIFMCKKKCKRNGKITQKRVS
jgi:hypothetical protein